MVICGAKKAFFIISLAESWNLHYMMLWTLDIVTADPLASLLPIETISKRIIISRPLEITSKIWIFASVVIVYMNLFGH